MDKVKEKKIKERLKKAGFDEVKIETRQMTEEEHIQRHIEFHKILDEMVADFMQDTDKKGEICLPSTTSLMDFMNWSYEQADRCPKCGGSKNGYECDVCEPCENEEIHQALSDQNM